jgi:hypothetical protein
VIWLDAIDAMRDLLISAGRLDALDAKLDWSDPSCMKWTRDDPEDEAKSFEIYPVRPSLGIKL